MKKITIEGSDKKKEYIVHDRLNIVGMALQFKCVDGMAGAVSLSMSKVTIEPYVEPKEWCVVFGIGSRRFWCQKMKEYDKETQVMMRFELQKHEAENMANDFNDTKDCY